MEFVIIKFEIFDNLKKLYFNETHKLGKRFYFEEERGIEKD